MTSLLICSPLPSAIEVDNYPHLQGLQLADECDQPQRDVDILVGLNLYWNIVTGDVVKAQGGPTAVSSKLGWLLSGPMNSLEPSPVSHACIVIGGVPTNPFINEKGDNMLVSSLRDFWELESLGIAHSPADSCESSLFPPSISFHDDRYFISLPWKPDHPEIPEHLSLCEGRLKSLLRKFQSNPEMLREYNQTIKDQLKAGIIEIVKPDTQSESSQGNYKSFIHYLPHHGVVREDNQTTKLRIVYDGSARALGDSYSLNDCLQTGPNYIPKLFNILVQFRWHKIAITADVEKAFLMIGIDPADRDFLHFLWVKDPCKLPYELIHLRFTRLVFGLRPSPAILGSVLAYYIKKFDSEFPELTKKLRDSFM